MQSLPVRQTYQRKCFRSILLWKCGSFRDSRITDTPCSCIVYAVCPLFQRLILHTCPSVEYISSLFGTGPSTTVIEKTREAPHFCFHLPLSRSRTNTNSILWLSLQFTTGRTIQIAVLMSLWTILLKVWRCLSF